MIYEPVLRQPSIIASPCQIRSQIYIRVLTVQNDINQRYLSCSKPPPGGSATLVTGVFLIVHTHTHTHNVRAYILQILHFVLHLRGAIIQAYQIKPLCQFQYRFPLQYTYAEKNFFFLPLVYIEKIVETGCKI